MSNSASGSIRSSRPEVFCKKGVLRNSQVFSCEFCDISKNTFSYRTPPVAASGLFMSLSYQLNPFMTEAVII